MAKLIIENADVIKNEYVNAKALLRERNNMPKVRTIKVRDKKGFSTKKPIL